MTLHLDIPTRRQLERLQQDRASWFVSIYLPTSQLPLHADRNRLELGGLVTDAVRPQGAFSAVCAG